MIYIYIYTHTHGVECGHIRGGVVRYLVGGRIYAALDRVCVCDERWFMDVVVCKVGNG